MYCLLRYFLFYDDDVDYYVDYYEMIIMVHHP